MRREKRRYDLLSCPLDKVSLIAIEEIDRPGFSSGQFFFEPLKIRSQNSKPLFYLDIDLLSQIIGDLANDRVFPPFLDYHIG